MVSKQDDPLWFRALDRFGPATMAMVFCGAVLWYGGGWTGRELVKPAADKIVERVCAGLDENVEVMKSVRAAMPEIASATRAGARTQEQIAKTQDQLVLLLKGIDSRQVTLQRDVSELKRGLAAIVPDGPFVPVQPRKPEEAN